MARGDREHRKNKSLAPTRAAGVSGRMHIDRDRLIWLALAALEELVDEAKDGPVRPLLTARVTLATAYAFSDGQRGSYDDFWKMLQDPCTHQHNDSAANYVRRTYMRTHLYRIHRSLGIPPTPATSQVLFEMRRLRASRPPEGVSTDENGEGDAGAVRPVAAGAEGQGGSD